METLGRLCTPLLFKVLPDPAGLLFPNLQMRLCVLKGLGPCEDAELLLPVATHHGGYRVMIGLALWCSLLPSDGLPQTGPETTWCMELSVTRGPDNPNRAHGPSLDFLNGHGSHQRTQ